MLRFKKRRWPVIAGIFAVIFIVLFNLWRSEIEKNRQIAVGPFRIAGNLYYVGTNSVTSFLLTGPQGHVLIDGAYPETPPMIINSVSKLGYDIKDVKILLNSHAHADHAGGLAALKKASGAQLWASEADAAIIEAGGKGDPSFGPLTFIQFFGLGTYPATPVDQCFKEGDTIRLGPIKLTAHITPGHTPGCTSWSFTVKDGERELLAVSIGSLNILPFMSLVEPETYPGIRKDFEQSFKKLRGLPADIFLASHANWFGLERKMRMQATSQNPADPFIDREGYLNFIDESEHYFQKVLSDQQKEE